jgi:nitrogenase molybdenum-iron protein alpha chain
MAIAYIPRIEVDIWCFDYVQEGLRKIGIFFGIENRAEALIAEEGAKYKSPLDWYKQHLTGRKFVSGQVVRWTKDLEDESGGHVLQVWMPRRLQVGALVSALCQVTATTVALT